MIQKVLALFGFARRDVQAGIPAYFALIGLAAAGYFGGAIVALLARAIAWHWTVDAGIRGFGVVAGLLVFHSAWRAVIHGDEYSWGGVIRRLFLR